MSIKLDTSIIGRVVESIWREINGQSIAIVFADSSIARFSAQGDCCANAWVEHVEVYDFKGPLLSAESTGFSNPSELQEDHDVLDQEFITFKTERGRMIVDLRTSHKGYYGGYLSFSHCKRLPEGEWREVQ